MIYFRAHINILLCAILFVTAASGILAAEGDLDLSFEGDGIVITDNGSSNESISDLVAQPDGKIIAVGFITFNSGQTMQTVMARYNPNGNIDSSFGTNGKVIIESVFPAELALQPNGKIVLVGRSGSTPNIDSYVARLNSDGSFDASFNGTGAIKLDLRGTDDIPASVKILPDGKILIGGTSKRPDTTTGSDYAIVRFNTDGSLDATFDGDGKVFAPISPQGSDSLADLVIQPDGKIVTAGFTYTYDSSGSPLLQLFLIVRFNPNGSLDTSFDGDGIVSTMVGRRHAETRSIALQNDGKIIAVGNTTDPIYPTGRAGIVRYNIDGSLDTSFGTGGQAIIVHSHAPDSTPEDVVIQADNKIVIAGSIGSIKSRFFAVARLNTNGSLDTTFSSDGWNVIFFPTYTAAQASAVAIQPDGKIISGGAIYSSNFSNSDFLLARFQASSCLANCFHLRQRVADFDGDGKTDLSVFRPSNAYWYILNSSRGFSSVQWGLPTDRLVPGDYDGDGRTDTAVYRNGTFSSAPDNNTWYILRSLDHTLVARQFGSSTGFSYGTPVPADYDGDGRTDLAVYDLQDTVGTPGSFRILQSSNNLVVIRQWGLNTDSRVPADYDGDGKADLAVYRPSNGAWYILRSRDGFYAIQFGASEDKPVASDYDGDGKADQAVFRPSNGVWYVWGSKDNSFSAAQFGISTDKPVPGDYDGDGKTDFAVYRNGTWYILNSTNGFSASVFGTATDKPVPNAFVP